MKKKTAVLTAVFLLIFPLSGCGRKADIASRAIVSAVAISREASGVTVTVEFLEKVGAEDKQRYDTAQGKGITIADAVSVIEGDIGHNLYLDNCRVLLVGGVQHRDALLALLSAVDADRRIRPLTMVAISMGDPGEMIINKQDKETSVGKKIQELLGSKEIAQYTLKDCLNLLRTPGRGLLLPLVDQDEMYFVAGYTPLSGTGFFLDEKVAVLVPLLGHDSTPVTVAGQDGVLYDLLLERNSLRVRPGWREGQPFFCLEISLEGNLISASAGGLAAGEITRRAAEALEERGRKDYNFAVENFYRLAGVDVLALGKRFSLKYPGEWDKISKDWESYIKNLECEIVVTAKVQDQREIIS